MAKLPRVSVPKKIADSREDQFNVKVSDPLATRLRGLMLREEISLVEAMSRIFQAIYDAAYECRMREIKQPTNVGVFLPPHHSEAVERKLRIAFNEARKGWMNAPVICSGR